MPPLAASYHFNVPPGQLLAVIVTVPAPHLELPVPFGAPGIVFTVAVTCVLGPSQPAELVHETQ